MLKSLAKAAPWTTLACFMACSSSSAPVGPGSNQTGQPCTSGVTKQCTCSDGSTQTQSCGASGTYDACPCPGGGGSSSGSGSSGSGGSSGSNSSGGSSSGSSGGSSSGSSGGSSSGGSPKDAGGDAMTTATGPVIPALPASCPTLATGMATVMGHQVQLWVGNKQANQKGSVLFYWHGTGSNSGEAMSEMGPQITEIVAGGGIVASFTDSTMSGETINNNVWYTGDIPMADTILACAVKQLNIDTTRIYVAGCSAGGLMAGSMAFLRSSYVAASMPNSGGVIGNFTLESAHAPAIITAHGAAVPAIQGGDMVTVYFQATSLDADDELAARGAFAVDCNHGGGHCGAPSTLIELQWEFCKAHPFGVSPEPYASGLPSAFPSYCSVIKPPAADAGSPYACRGPADCGSGNVCCLTAGPIGSITMGESSACMPAGAQNGSAGQCPSGKVQLCKTSADCSGGQTCALVEGGYCH